ncbi:MAG: hypothetical protein H6744_07350 [Deltaproteobacteria bacterium]|nr:hypothetical protein [Deltaproteobacteria bacterium]MCB9786495.1 hypothetical protein [Deltaproteobacteria bacterium]
MSTSNHGLNSDGLTLAQFLPLWRDAMWHAVDPNERARLMLELGRARARERSGLETLLVAFTPRKDPPLSVIPLDAVPTIETGTLRDNVRQRLAELQATEVYVLLTQRATDQAGQACYVLVAWGENVDGERMCWMQAFRYKGEHMDEAPPFFAPDASETAVDRRLAGLLMPLH